MPYFTTAPSSSLSASLRRAVGMGSGELDPLQAVKIEQAAAHTARELTLADKARLESENMRRAAADRASPELATEYASNAAGLDLPTGTRLGGHLRGLVEPWSAGDAEDAAVAGADAPAYRMAAPNVSPAERRLFQSAIGATIANRIATGKTNAQQLAKTGGELQDNQLTEEAIKAPTNAVANRIIAAMSGHTYTPFRTGAQGQVLDTGSGDLSEAGAIPQGNVSLMRARTGEASAKARFADAGVPMRGAQTRLAGARADQVVQGKPATPIAPQRVARMIDMSTLAEYKAERAVYDALPLSKRNAMTAPTMAAVRERVRARYEQPDTAQEIAEANAALNAPNQTEANRTAIRARFRQRKGFDLPAQVAAAGAADDNNDDDTEE